MGVLAVHNRVSSIDAAAARVRELVPEAGGGRARGRFETCWRPPCNGSRTASMTSCFCTTHRDRPDISNANTGRALIASAVPAAPVWLVGCSRERGLRLFLYPLQVPLTETALRTGWVTIAEQ